MSAKTVELEKKLADMRETRAKAEEGQYEKDLEARIALEEEHGNIAAVKVAQFVPGFPTRAYLRTPIADEYRRYKQTINRAVIRDKRDPDKVREAGELLAKSCWIYPATEQERNAMLDTFPGLLTPLGLAAQSLAEGQSEEEGNG